MDNQKLLIKELSNYLEHPHTHRIFSDIVKDFPEKLMNEKPQNIPYTFWQLLEHIRISQFDMLDFIQNPNYNEIKWPEDYWPDSNEKATRKMWDEAINKYEEDIKSLKKIIEDPEVGFFAPIPHGTGQTIFREMLQIIDHASYHIGQFIVMRRMVNQWK